MDQKRVRVLHRRFLVNFCCSSDSVKAVHNYWFFCLENWIKQKCVVYELLWIYLLCMLVDLKTNIESFSVTFPHVRNWVIHAQILFSGEQGKSFSNIEGWLLLGCNFSLKLLLFSGNPLNWLELGGSDTIKAKLSTISRPGVARNYKHTCDLLSHSLGQG